MSESVDLVKKVLDDISAWRAQQKPDSGSIPRFERNIVLLEDAYDHVVRLAALTSALPPDLGNVYDLPAELREELSIAKTDELEDQIVTVINAYGGEATLDQVLVGLFRKFKVSQKRRFMQNKLYRMPMVWNVEGRKGIYTTAEPEEGQDSTSDEDSEENGEKGGGGGFSSGGGGYFNNDLDDEIPF